jgi:FecR protein
MARKAEAKAIAKFAIILMSASAWNMRSLHAQQIATPPSTAASADSKSPQDLNPSHGSRKVAIAWLSDVKGEVQLANSTGREFQPVYAHTPVTEGNVIQTGMGRAEVEFEDNSTVRLGPYSLVEFPRLGLLPSGARASNVSVLKGTVYVSIIPAYIVKAQWNDFQLMFGQQLLHLQPSSHVRLELDATGARLAVLDGAGRCDGPFGPTELVKKRTFTFSFVGQLKPAVVNKVAANPMDAWDSSAVTFHQNNAKSGKMSRNLFEPPLAP